jgi:hypothetical protein
VPIVNAPVTCSPEEGQNNSAETANDSTSLGALPILPGNPSGVSNGDDSDTQAMDSNHLVQQGEFASTPPEGALKLIAQ